MEGEIRKLKLEQKRTTKKSKSAREAVEAKQKVTTVMF